VLKELRDVAVKRTTVRFITAPEPQSGAGAVIVSVMNTNSVIIELLEEAVFPASSRTQDISALINGDIT